MGLALKIASDGTDVNEMSGSRRTSFLLSGDSLARSEPTPTNGHDGTVVPIWRYLRELRDGGRPALDLALNHVADRQMQLIAARRPPPRHACARAGKRYRAFSFSLGNSFPSGECYMRDVQCERAGCHSERPPSMKPPSCGACGGHPIPNI